MILLYRYMAHWRRYPQLFNVADIDANDNPLLVSLSFGLTRKKHVQAVYMNPWQGHLLCFVNGHRVCGAQRYLYPDSYDPFTVPIIYWELFGFQFDGHQQLWKVYGVWCLEMMTFWLFVGGSFCGFFSVFDRAYLLSSVRTRLLCLFLFSGFLSSCIVVGLE